MIKIHTYFLSSPHTFGTKKGNQQANTEMSEDVTFLLKVNMCHPQTGSSSVMQSCRNDSINMRMRHRLYICLSSIVVSGWPYLSTFIMIIVKHNKCTLLLQEYLSFKYERNVGQNKGFSLILLYQYVHLLFYVEFKFWFF